jgi:hypothetical protein
MGAEFVLIPLGVIFVLAVVIYKVKSTQVGEFHEADPNAPLVENNYRREYTDGYSLGHLKKRRDRKNGTVYISYFPLDKKQGKNVKSPPVQELIVKKEYVISLPRGTRSDERERIVLVPRNASQIPEFMRDSLEAKWESVEGQKAHIEAVFGVMISSGDEALIEAMKSYSRGGMSKEMQEEFNAQLNAFKKMLLAKDQDNENK